ncbi:MAG: hypothetical protein NE330_09020, partial [Lentisphaeraceae bacterium]|nr:hypothetical protein [Lentisphaeraceae bacterium]
MSEITLESITVTPKGRDWEDESDKFCLLNERLVVKLKFKGKGFGKKFEGKIGLGDFRVDFWAIKSKYEKTISTQEYYRHFQNLEDLEVKIFDENDKPISDKVVTLSIENLPKLSFNGIEDKWISTGERLSVGEKKAKARISLKGEIPKELLKKGKIILHAFGKEKKIHEKFLEDEDVEIDFWEITEKQYKEPQSVNKAFIYPEQKVTLEVVGSLEKYIQFAEIKGVKQNARSIRVLDKPAIEFGHKEKSDEGVFTYKGWFKLGGKYTETPVLKPKAWEFSGTLYLTREFAKNGGQTIDWPNLNFKVSGKNHTIKVTETLDENLVAKYDVKLAGSAVKFIDKQENPHGLISISDPQEKYRHVPAERRIDFIEGEVLGFYSEDVPGPDKSKKVKPFYKEGNSVKLEFYCLDKNVKTIVVKVESETMTFTKGEGTAACSYGNESVSKLVPSKKVIDGVETSLYTAKVTNLPAKNDVEFTILKAENQQSKPCFILEEHSRLYIDIIGRPSVRFAPKWYELVGEKGKYETKKSYKFFKKDDRNVPLLYEQQKVKYWFEIKKHPRWPAEDIIFSVNYEYDKYDDDLNFSHVTTDKVKVTIKPPDLEEYKVSDDTFLYGLKTAQLAIPKSSFLGLELKIINAVNCQTVDGLDKQEIKIDKNSATVNFAASAVRQGLGSWSDTLEVNAGNTLDLRFLLDKSNDKLNGKEVRIEGDCLKKPVLTKIVSGQKKYEVQAELKESRLSGKYLLRLLSYDFALMVGDKSSIAVNICRPTFELSIGEKNKKHKEGVPVGDKVNLVVKTSSKL